VVGSRYFSLRNVAPNKSFNPTAEVGLVINNQLASAAG
jgi:hypothetical protein